MKIAFDIRGKKRSADQQHSYFKTSDRYYLSTVILLICLLPLYLAASGRLGLKPLILLILMGATGFTTELLGSIITKKPIRYFGVATWILFPLMLPPGIPVWMALISFVLGLVLSQILFGGFGKHLFHPGVIGQIFLMINFAKMYNSSFLKPFSSMSFGFSVYSSQSFTTQSTLSVLKEMPDISLEQLFQGPNIGLIGEMFPVLIIICGAVYLLLSNVNHRTSLSFLSVFILFSFLGNRFRPEEVMSAAPALLGGGTLFYAFFIFSDRWSSAKTNGGRIIAGITAALLTILIRSYSSNVEGIMFAAIFNYSFSPLYDEIIFYFHSRKKSAL